MYYKESQMNFALYESHLKALSKNGSNILKQMLPAEGTHRRVENSPFMPLTIEFIYPMLPPYDNIPEKYKWVSLCHYADQNCDLMADPEIVFIHNTQTNKFYPVYYKNDFIGLEQFVYSMRLKNFTDAINTDKETEELVWVEDRKMNQELVDFSNTWMKNLKDQGYMSAKESNS